MSKNIKNFILSDRNLKSLSIKRVVQKILNKNFSKDIKIVIGGDGFMLKILKKFKNSNFLFYGINSGNYGFLMNKFVKTKLIKNISRSKVTIISPLEMTVFTKSNKIKKIAINEISILRQSKQAANLLMKINSKTLIKKLVSDGALVSTPAGSTAYNFSVNGPILNLNSKKISIAPISAFRPRKWSGKIVSENSKIIIVNLDPIKRPISAVADNIEIRNVKKVLIQIKKDIKFKLLYDQGSSLQKKIKLEQLRSEVN